MWRVSAALTTVHDKAAGAARLQEVVEAPGSLADLADGSNLPRWWDAPPLALKLESAAHAARDAPPTQGGGGGRGLCLGASAGRCGEGHRARLDSGRVRVGSPGSAQPLERIRARQLWTKGRRL